MIPIHIRIAEELSVASAQVAAAVALLDEGATVPFISRYRKEATGGLDDTQLRTLETRLAYLRELEDRRAAILQSIADQGKLTPELEVEVRAADTKGRLEDLYLPYKPKRRTKGQIAREAGLEPLALALKENPALSPEDTAQGYVDAEKGVPDVKAALEGAKHILMELFAEDADLVGRLRDYSWDHGKFTARVIEGKEAEGAKYRDYFEHSEPVRDVPSHRALAMFRGFHEGILYVALAVGEEPERGTFHVCEGMIAKHWGVENKGRPADAWLAEVVRWTWRVKLFSHIQTDLLGRVRERAETEAIRVFAANLKDLLLAAPAGHKGAIGLDPGLRTGVKVAVVDATGKFVDHDTIYPHAPRNDEAGAARSIIRLAEKHGIKLVAIGNGTASRETDRLVGEIIKARPDLGLMKVVVSEAGASVYSASELAAQEFPDLDVTIRGAVSIARRLQDPLAELVKIEPKAIGVGQYQHDVNQTELARSLDAVVEDCVNAVGVDVNTASAPLLARVSGLSRTIADNIVAFRDTHGAFRSRKVLKEVPRLGPKTFELAAGFLRVPDGENPLDASAVHPESYVVVERIATRAGRELSSLIGDSGFLRTLKPADYTDEHFGVPTVTDILAELEKPGRDPRPEFKTAQLREGVEKISDLEPGMILEGTVTNVANFGAFVDIGVHQDGLVHISALAEKFVRDPREVVRAGDIVKVKVLEVDAERKRIALTMRLNDPLEKTPRQGGAPRSQTTGGRPQALSAPRGPKPPEPSPKGGGFADLFAKAKEKAKK
jgi:uncharacterized protein